MTATQGQMRSFNSDGHAIADAESVYVAMVHLETKPENLKDYMDAVRRILPHTQAEAGFVRYEMLQDPGDPNRLTFVEVYKDKAAFDAHFSSDYVRAFMEETPRYIAAQGKGEFFTATKDREIPVEPK